MLQFKKQFLTMLLFDACEFYGFVQNKYPESAKLVFQAILEFKETKNPVTESIELPRPIKHQREDKTVMNGFYNFLIGDCLKKHSTATTYKTTIGTFLRQHELQDKSPQDIIQFLEKYQERKPDGIKNFIKFLETKKEEQNAVLIDI